MRERGTPSWKILARRGKRAPCHTVAMTTVAAGVVLAPAAALAELPPDWEEALAERDLGRLTELVDDAQDALPLGTGRQSLLHIVPRYEAGGDEAPLFAMLMARGLDPRAVDEGARTPLHMAAAYDCVPCVQLLLAAEVDVAARRQDGGTALHRAGPASQPILVAAGADPAARDEDGRVPLHTARTPTEVLLAAGIDAADRFGFTPLHYAALAGDEERIQWLLDHGADPKRESTAPYDHREGVLAAEFDPVHRFEPGRRPYDLAKWQYDRTKWSTSRYTKAKELLDRVTPRRSWRSR